MFLFTEKTIEFDLNYKINRISGIQNKIFLIQVQILVTVEVKI